MKIVKDEIKMKNKVYLDYVSYSEKNNAKAMGARWCNE